MIDTDRVTLFVGALGATAGAIWGSLSGVFQTLLLLMILDTVTGFVAAWVTRTLDSDIASRGAGRKMIAVCVVIGANVAEPLFGGVPAGAAVAGFYCAAEALSLVENASRAGVPVPNVLRQALAKLREQTGGSGPPPPVSVNDG